MSIMIYGRTGLKQQISKVNRIHFEVMTFVRVNHDEFRTFMDGEELYPRNEEKIIEWLCKMMDKHNAYGKITTQNDGYDKVVLELVRM